MVGGKAVSTYGRKCECFRNCAACRSSRTPSSSVILDSRLTLRGRDGHNLFTLVASQRALEAGADLAGRLNDTGAASFYASQARAIGHAVVSFYDEERGYWLSSMDYEQFQPYIPAQLQAAEERAESMTFPDREWLDCSLPLTLIHASQRQQSGVSDKEDGSHSGVSLSPSHPTVLATLYRYIRSFDGLYDINRHRKWTRGWALGRYKEDVYDGVGQSRANPW